MTNKKKGPPWKSEARPSESPIPPTMDYKETAMPFVAPPLTTTPLPKLVETEMASKPKSDEHLRDLYAYVCDNLTEENWRKLKVEMERRLLILGGA